MVVVSENDIQGLKGNVETLLNKDYKNAIEDLWLKLNDILALIYSGQKLKINGDDINHELNTIQKLLNWQVVGNHWRPKSSAEVTQLVAQLITKNPKIDMAAIQTQLENFENHLKTKINQEITAQNGSLSQLYAEADAALPAFFNIADIAEDFKPKSIFAKMNYLQLINQDLEVMEKVSGNGIKEIHSNIDQTIKELLDFNKMKFNDIYSHTKNSTLYFKLIEEGKKISKEIKTITTPSKKLFKPKQALWAQLNFTKKKDFITRYMKIENSLKAMHGLVEIKTQLDAIKSLDAGPKLQFFIDWLQQCEAIYQHLQAEIIKSLKSSSKITSTTIPKLDSLKTELENFKNNWIIVIEKKNKVLEMLGNLEELLDQDIIKKSEKFKSSIDALKTELENLYTQHDTPETFLEAFDRKSFQEIHDGLVCTAKSCCLNDNIQKIRTANYNGPTFFNRNNKVLNLNQPKVAQPIVKEPQDLKKPIFSVKGLVHSIFKVKPQKNPHQEAPFLIEQDEQKKVSRTGREFKQ